MNGLTWSSLFGAEDLATFGPALTASRGHYYCGGFTADSRSPDFMCECGRVLFSLVPVEALPRVEVAS